MYSHTRDKCIVVVTHTSRRAMTDMCVHTRTHAQNPGTHGRGLRGREGAAPPAPSECCMCRWPSDCAWQSQRRIRDNFAEQQSVWISATWAQMTLSDYFTVSVESLPRVPDSLHPCRVHPRDAGVLGQEDVQDRPLQQGQVRASQRARPGPGASCRPHHTPLQALAPPFLAVGAPSPWLVTTDLHRSVTQQQTAGHWGPHWSDQRLRLRQRGHVPGPGWPGLGCHSSWNLC